MVQNVAEVRKRSCDIETCYIACIYIRARGNGELFFWRGGWPTAATNGVDDSKKESTSICEASRAYSELRSTAH